MDRTPIYRGMEVKKYQQKKEKNSLFLNLMEDYILPEGDQDAPKKKEIPVNFLLIV